MGEVGLIYHHLSGGAADTNEVEAALLHGDSNLIVAGDNIELSAINVV